MRIFERRSSSSGLDASLKVGTGSTTISTYVSKSVLQESLYYSSGLFLSL